MRLKKTTSGLMVMGLAALLPQWAIAGNGTGSTTEDPVPPNVFFLIDNSSSMATCFAADRTDTNLDGKITDDDACTPASSDASSEWRMATVVKAVTAIVENTDSAYFGLAVTDPVNSADPDGIGTTTGRDGILVPLGSTRDEFLTVLNTLQTGATDDGAIQASAVNAVPLAEALDDVRAYFETGAGTSNSDYSGSPIDYYCQQSHIILITDGVTPLDNTAPTIDTNVSSIAGVYAASPDLTGSTSTEGYYNQKLDNVASYLANSDLSVLKNSPSGQHVVTHVMVLDNPTDLLSYVTDNSEGIYGVIDTTDSSVDPDDLEGELWGVLNTISQGTYSKAPPTIAVDGDKLFLGYYDIKPDRPLYYGHLVAYDIQNDPNQANYGEIDTSVSQPAWDAGEILASRWVGIQDKMDEDNNGEGWRDIYTNIDDDSTLDPFDASNMSSIAPLCELMLNTEEDAVTGDFPGVAEGHDVDGDGDVDLDDCSMLMDFVRGFHLEEFTSTGQPRGHWKLGDIRHSQAVVAEMEPNIYTRNPYLRAFLDDEIAREMTDCPYSSEEACQLNVVFVAANDGMLHAFSKATGDELWAFIPQNLLGNVLSADEEKAELLDLMRGETLILDATPRIEYVWIDGYQGEGVYSKSERDGDQKVHEWARVLFLGQGGGGRFYVALDITDPQFPTLLWEDTNDDDPIGGLGDSTSTAVAGLIFDSKNSPAYDQWVAFWGSGHEEGNSIDARLYIKSMNDLWDTTPSKEMYEDTGISVKVDLDSDGTSDGTGFPSNPTVVDKDNDGDIDEVFLVNAAGVMYKFVINTAAIDKTEGCLFFDPQATRKDPSASTNTYIGARTASYWAATAAINADGSMILYWGTGSPYDMFTTDDGFFYAVLDSDGCEEGSLYTRCNDTGYMQLESGEKLTGSPLVYSNTVYFTTYAPSSDRCSEGEARLYGLNSEDCSYALDTNGDGSVDSSTDDAYMAIGEGIPSGVTIANGSIYVATSSGLDGSGGVEDSVNQVAVGDDPFAGTVAIQWRELF